MEGTAPQLLQLTVSWDPQVGIPMPVNQFAIVQGTNTGDVPSPLYELHLGHVSPPMLPSEGDAQALEQLQGMHLLINRVGHFQVSVDVLRQMHEILGTVVGAYDEQVGRPAGSMEA